MKPKVKKILRKIKQDRKDNTKWLKEALEKAYDVVLNVGWQYEIKLDSGDMDNPLVLTEYYYGVDYDTILLAPGKLTDEEFKSGLYWDCFSHIAIVGIRGIKVKQK